ncbi:hypothetical protein BJV38_001297 [Clostridium beijerinckii]|nr:hypothetical protein [Clostridium beijerinckii]NRT44454.1 hypothetical protein [Clostridium beijerinckii]NRZ21554.1 hypothetical protein [Clostridium beijerinckii]
MSNINKFCKVSIVYEMRGNKIMECINVDGKDYRLIIGAGDDDTYRMSFNALT